MESFPSDFRRGTEETPKANNSIVAIWRKMIYNRYQLFGKVEISIDCHPFDMDVYRQLKKELKERGFKCYLDVNVTKKWSEGESDPLEEVVTHANLVVV